MTKFQVIVVFCLRAIIHHIIDESYTSRNELKQAEMMLTEYENGNRL